LKPEKSQGWELGIEQSFANDAALLGLTYFDNTLENEIYTQFTPTFISMPSNRTTESTQKGVELFAVANVGEAWRFDVSYTHLDAKENGIEEVRRPPDIASLNVNWAVLADRASLNLTVRYNGETYDNNFTGVGPMRVLLGDYTLVNLGADYQINDRLNVYGRIENLLDELYEEVYTYRTPGRAAYLGIRSSF
ncbi:MAG TPA: TonB-dependent receptor, partial [Steroidobacter sp.]|nr:TonB-dependent receptor [Steroidobacter sp.]